MFIVAIREVESWLLADIEGLSEFTGVSIHNFPQNPDVLKDPKAELLRIVRKSRIRNIKEDILPKNNFATIGPNYNGRLGEFVNQTWSQVRAAKRSDSLARAIRALTTFEFLFSVQ
ncbi:MAG: hypothetical protein IPM69_11685 [Ignavibacteria bacterium]|nr:hypothetical protein [Ignavibacteria bacterium]